VQTKIRAGGNLFGTLEYNYIHGQMLFWYKNGKNFEYVHEIANVTMA
jgi:hypothetical protein